MKRTKLLSLLMASSFIGFAQLPTPGAHFTVCIDHVTSTANTIEMDVNLVVDGTATDVNGSGKKGMRIQGVYAGINYNADILNGGTPCATMDCGSWAFVPGTRDKVLTALQTTLNTTRVPYGQLRIIMTPLSKNAAPDVENGTYRIGRYRFTNSINWAPGSDAQLWLSPTNVGGASNTIVNAYPYGGTAAESKYAAFAYTTTNPSNGSGLTLCANSKSKVSLPLGPSALQEQNFSTDFKVYPNPSANLITVELNVKQQETTTVKIADQSGNIVKQITSKTEAGAQKLEISLSELASGIYSVQVFENDQLTHVGKVRKNN